MSSPAPRSIEIADLAGMSLVDLIDLYRAGTMPDSLQALDSASSARMLAVRWLDWRPPHALLARAARSRFFPWAGKRFQHLDRNQGTGSNRIRLLGERSRYPFHTRVGTSAIDGAPCVVLDYDRPDNPRAIRAIRDELREVSPGLFLGPGMLQVLGKPRLALFFVCDSVPAAAH